MLGSEMEVGVVDILSESERARDYKGHILGCFGSFVFTGGVY